ncbi:hypothetical protein LJR290_007808 [Variovorax sp. LjRoot290]|uniref:hypothetical protein n=1 Tax=Variovorax sp. LjRoot290 TaxID=3342316 RepID=UPI003ECDD714
MVHDADEPGFDNREARDTLSESLDDPIDVDPKEGLEGEAAPTKKSTMPFYAAVGAFAVVALGLVGYKSGLIGGSARKPIEPTVAMAMAETPKKPDSLMGATGASTGGRPDLLGGDAKPRSDFDVEADLLSGKGPGSGSAPSAAAAPVVAVVEPAKPEPVVQAAAVPAPAPAPTPAAPAVVEKQKPVAPRVEVAKSEPVTPAAAAPVRPARTETSEAGAAAANAAPGAAKPTRIAAARDGVPRTKVAVARSVAAKPVRVAEVRKPSKGKRASQVVKDATPESTEVLAGWKLRGTWPTHGPSQFAWIADENGRLSTVSVGTRVSGARVVSIGKRGEVVQTTAGQILP